MKRRRRLAAWAALAAAGCSESALPPVAPEPTVHLSSEDRDGNAAAVAAFFRKICIEAGASPATVGAALHDSGWAYEQIQSSTTAMPIAAWRLDNGELVHSVFSAGPGADFIDCQLALDAEVAPSVARMRDTLLPMIRHRTLRQSGDAPLLKWQWQPEPGERRELTIQTAAIQSGPQAGSPRLAIHFSTSVVPPPRAPAGNENVQ